VEAVVAALMDKGLVLAQALAGVVVVDMLPS
jgi:hypothetical protein